MSNNTEYKYHLATWHERDKTLRCPGCGKGRRCFKEYVDDEGNPVDPSNHTCGKCDHETSCGYHLSPKEFFKLHPDERKDISLLPHTEQKQLTRIEIEPSLVGRFHKMTVTNPNAFVRWMKQLPMNSHERATIDQLLAMYAIGTTKDDRIIWWQIDENRVVRTGKIMRYVEQTGKRAKDEDGNAVDFGWVHAMLRRKFGMYNEKDYQLVQCLFGQHLLPICPDAEVHIVESEKTALLMAHYDDATFSRHIWLATGGKYNLNEAAFTALRGRKVFVYPDADGVDEWRERCKGHKVTIVTKWMDKLEPEDKKADVGDMLLRMLTNPKTPSEASNPLPIDKATPTSPLLKNELVKLAIELLNLEPLNDERR